MAGESNAPASGTPQYTVPGMSTEDGGRVATILQDRLFALTDLHLTLKHVHWNVVGPHFIAVHEMLDPQVDAVREMSDQVAERVATLGASPSGTPGALVRSRSWDDYSIGRAGAIEHLGALDLVYSGVIGDHRRAIEETGDLDPVTEDLLIGQAGQLEQYHWFVRAHLETAGGGLATAGATSEVQATEQALQRAGEGRASA
ncbi:Dps family protein [Kineococcus sp. SYSU DK004]|uniref:Dps family protein n=1 Tax=Kineococcus sp. SYSU DK004 TaxID=3383125 RepID=UPI003D7E592C